MGLFSSADENEIARRKEQQEQQAADLSKREAALKREQERLAERQQALEVNESDYEKRLGVLTAGELMLARRELAAREGFVEQQRAAFREVIEGRIRELDQRQESLACLQKELETRLARLTQQEGDLAARQQTVFARELQADAGFADKARVFNEQIEVRIRACEEHEKQLKQREKDMSDENALLKQTSEELEKREGAIRQAEAERDAGYTKQREKLNMELLHLRQKVELECCQIRSDCLDKVKQECDALRTVLLENAARDEAAERDRLRAATAAERVAHEREMDAQRAAARQESDRLAKLRGQIDADQDQVKFDRERLARKDRHLKEALEGIEAEVDKLVAARRRSFEKAEASLHEEKDRLQKALATTQSLLGCFEELKRRLGDEPEKVLLDLNTKTDELRELRERLATEPSEEWRKRLEDQKQLVEKLRRESDEQKQVAERVQDRLAGEHQLRVKLDEAETTNRSLNSRLEIFDAECARLNGELKRMRAGYERADDRQARIRDIETPVAGPWPAVRPGAETDELKWLNGIDRQCTEYGLRFHPRILRAFHTALKTAEWSPLTVLAGVSGTGKSELPRLYAHFGGLPFFPLAVQPNWDSQEAMLGFFNSIDNKFDAQPVLRFLAQSQKKAEGEYPGLLDAVSLILLDELNLAHPELFFAEFLSKLELRRGRKGGDVPSLDVKLGAGLEPYQLPLGRNVLWAGTMNQDETTKSLSDKVLDRSIVIHFPRPTSLERRKELKPLPSAAPLLPRKVWQSWWAQESDFTDEEIRSYKLFIEDMNTALAKVGRALGHRVWQSIEYYMANYPEVRACRKTGDGPGATRAMRTAFEDQLVQKVMPKLRGIETRAGRGAECLDKIKDQLDKGKYGILDDFELACELGYGQFIWQSANYLRESEAAPPDTAPPDTAGRDTSTPPTVPSSPPVPDQAAAPAAPPDNFKPGAPDRLQQWEKLPDRLKQLYRRPQPPGTR